MEPPNNNHSWEHVFWPLLRVWLLSEVINTYFYVSRSMPLDCCREFSLFSGGLCSEVSLYVNVLDLAYIHEEFYAHIHE